MRQSEWIVLSGNADDKWDKLQKEISHRCASQNIPKMKTGKISKNRDHKNSNGKNKSICVKFPYKNH